MENGGDSIPGFSIDLSEFAYIAPFLGAALIGCFCLTLCCYLWRRVFAPRGYSNSFDSSSSSFRNNRRSAAPALRQGAVRGQMGAYGARRNTREAGQQFMSWARDQMNYPRNPMRFGQNQETRAGNNLLSPVAAEQYPRATQGRSNQNPRRMEPGSASNALSNSEGFSQATAPPPSYSHAVGYQNVPSWKLPGYGYHSTDPRSGGQGEETAGGEPQVLPPPYEAAVSNGQNISRT